MKGTTTIAIAVIIAGIVIGSGIAYYAYTSGNTGPKTTPNYLSTTSFTIADFGIDHPDAGAYGWMMNNSQNTSMTLQKYDPNIKLSDLPTGSGGVADALASGTAMMGMLSADGALGAMDKGLPITIVAVYRTSPIGDYVYVAPNSTYHHISDLNNTTFANSHAGSLDVLLNDILEAQYNITIHHDYVGSHEAQQSAVLNGKAAASTGAYFDVYKLVQAGTLRSVGNITENWPAFVIAANNTFIQDHPNAIKAALLGMQYGNYLFDQNAGNFAYNFLKSYYNFSASETTFYMQTMHFSTNGTIYLQSLNNELKSLQADNVISATNLTLSHIYTNKFVTVANTTYNPNLQIRSS